jgi:hypothetical protein
LEISDSRFQISDLPPVYQSKTERAGLRRIIAKNLKSETRNLKPHIYQKSEIRKLKSNQKLIKPPNPKVPFFAGNSAADFYIRIRFLRMQGVMRNIIIHWE